MDNKIDEILKTNLKNFITEQVDNMIDDQVLEFKRRLECNKDEYISHLMKNIRIIHEYNHNDNAMDYHIIFTNITKIKD